MGGFQQKDQKSSKLWIKHWKSNLSGRTSRQFFKGFQDFISRNMKNCQCWLNLTNNGRFRRKSWIRRDWPENIFIPWQSESLPKSFSLQIMAGFHHKIRWFTNLLDQARKSLDMDRTLDFYYLPLVRTLENLQAIVFQNHLISSSFQNSRYVLTRILLSTYLLIFVIIVLGVLGPLYFLKSIFSKLHFTPSE